MGKSKTTAELAPLKMTIIEKTSPTPLNAAPLMSNPNHPPFMYFATPNRANLIYILLIQVRFVNFSGHEYKRANLCPKQGQNICEEFLEKCMAYEIFIVVDNLYACGRD